MERILVVLSLLFSFTAFGAIPSGVPAQSLGVVATATNSTGSLDFFQDSNATYPTFTLYGGVIGTNTTANSYYPFYRDGTAYATPNNKKVYCKNFLGWGSTTALGFQLVTSTAAITFGQSAALTSPKYMCGADQRQCKSTTGSSSTLSPITGTFVGGDGSTITYLGFQAFSSAQNMALEMTCYEK